MTFAPVKQGLSCGLAPYQCEQQVLAKSRMEGRLGRGAYPVVYLLPLLDSSLIQANVQCLAHALGVEMPAE